jgi:hypothetical protein
MTPAYLSRALPTYIEKWPCDLLDFSIPHAGIRLSLDEARAIGANIGRYREWFTDSSHPQPLVSIYNKLEETLSGHPDGAFVRLCSRSAKDSQYATIYGLRITNASSAIKMLTWNSLRVAYDLKTALNYNYQPYLFVRQWIDIP